MGILDIIFLCVFALAAYKGYKSGLLISIISFLSLIIALVAAMNFTGRVSEYFLLKYPDREEIIPIVVFVGLLIIVILLITIVGRVLKKIIDMTLVGGFDSFAGALFGIIKWSFFISAFLWGLSYLNIVISEDYATNSHLLAYIEPIAPFVFDNFGKVMPVIEELIEPLKNLDTEQSEYFTSNTL
ncbi:MAG: CvpA family protein [Cyclobacteriaceae bacterium]